MKLRFPVLVALLALLSLGACGGGDATNPAGTTSTSLNVQPTVLATTDTVVGTGTAAAVGKVLTVNYSGWLFDSSQPGNKGVLFDTSIGRTPFTFTLGAGNVIQGWEQGLVGMKAGGSRTLVIPSALAYGPLGNGPIPSNASLIFDVQLISVQ